MNYYYVALQSKSHAFILESRMKIFEVQCELAYLPREIMKDLCNMGVKFSELYFEKAVAVLKSSGLPGWKLYLETVYPDGYKYTEVMY